MSEEKPIDWAWRWGAVRKSVEAAVEKGKAITDNPETSAYVQAWRDILALMNSVESGMLEAAIDEPDGT